MSKTLKGEKLMKTSVFTKKRCFTIILILASLMLISCQDDDDDDGDPRNGYLDNRTPYQVKVNFMGIKISEIASESMIRENALEAGVTYQIQVAILDNSSIPIEVIDSTVYIDKAADDHKINSQICSWYLKIWGETLPFAIESGS